MINNDFIYYKLSFIGLLFLILFSTCKHNNNALLPKDINQIIENSDNKGVLKEVIEYYSRENKDSLKLKAAFFLIRSLIDLKTLDTGELDQNKPYFDVFYKLSFTDRKEFNLRLISAKIDSVSKKMGGSPDKIETILIDDREILSSKFLINNIEMAFREWNECNWSKRIAFNNFLEYVLPYRCTNTYGENMRNLFINNYKRYLNLSLTNKDDSFEAAKLIDEQIRQSYLIQPNFFNKFPFLQPMKFSDIIRGRIGLCKDVVSIKVNALRSLGIPAAFDYIPNWGNSNGSHYFYKCIDTLYTSKKLITNEQRPFSYSNDFDRNIDIVGAFWKKDNISSLNSLPSNLKIYYCRTVPKVYRQNFSLQSSSLSYIKDSKDKIPKEFDSNRLKDVTDEYVVTRDIKISLEPTIEKQNFVYLCCFNNRIWQVVAWAKNENNTANFTKLGVNIVYLPAYYVDGKLIPAGVPFLLPRLGSPKHFTPQLNRRQVGEFLMKYHYRTHMVHSEMIGTTFHVANKADLSDSVEVKTISQLPFYSTTLNIKTKRKARFVFYKFNPNGGTISELQFWGKDKYGKETKLTGKKIGNMGIFGYEIEKAFDNDALTFFYPDKHKETYIGIDLGLGNEAILSKIIYAPKSDDNGIIPGQNYELLFWKNNNWISLGKKNGDKNKSVEFNNLPTNAIFLLKGQGKEQRIFTYENGKQIFW